MTTYEVEMKFRIDDISGLERKLTDLDAQPFSRLEQIDTYFAHPARDFNQTDEAFRLRRVGDENFVTYKGPKIDSTTKTRREIELSLPAGDEYVSRFRSLFEALGFTAVADVEKLRRKTFILWQGREVEVVLDDVKGVGQYAELELTADESTVEAARSCIESIASELDLRDHERRSYLELLLDA